MRSVLVATPLSMGTESEPQCSRCKEDSRCHHIGKKLYGVVCSMDLQFTDCRSLSDHLTASVPRQCDDKRLSIEMAGLRHRLWEDDTPSHIACKPHGDRLRWIPTHLQLADCLTKSMKPLLINQSIDTNVAQVRDVPDDTTAKQSGLRKTVGKADEAAT